MRWNDPVIVNKVMHEVVEATFDLIGMNLIEPQNDEQVIKILSKMCRNVVKFICEEN